LLFTTDESPLEDAAFGILHVGAMPIAGGKKSEYFTDDEASTIRPLLSIDGRSVYLTKISDASGRHTLWEYDLKGKPLRDITEERFARIHKLILHPTKTTAVLWAQEQPEQEEQIYLLDMKSGKISELPEPDLPKRSPALSPNGSLIAFVGPSESGNHLYLYDLTSGLIQRLTAKGTNIHSPVFITDDQILFGGEREGKKPDVVVKTVGNTTYTQEAIPDREIYLLSLSHKVEDEKKKK
jgi:Tol biopolymer transport system component